MLIIVLLVLAAWFLVGLGVALVFGKVIRARDAQVSAPAQVGRRAA